ncbi:MAG: polar amino acid transport system substrate-binding protein [Actinomycetota bacterium]|jgi:ABC-type amino acid transport substrate-binding protein|nr:polar amino acid transport system substrate-binding protein [Actinomycetota bacterium]
MPRRILVCLFALVALAACIPAEPNDDLKRTFDPEETVMGEIQQRGRLIVGIDPAAHPFTYCLDPIPAGCEWSGFTVDLAREVADSLGVDIKFVTGGATELLGMPEVGGADISFPFVPVTGRLVEPRDLAFTDPYYVAHERLLVRPDSEIQQAIDITTERVCESVNPGTGVPIEEINTTLTPVSASIEECAGMFADGRVDVVVGPDVLLAGIVELAGGVIVGDQLNTEGYSAVLETGASAWIDYVNQVLEEAQQEGRWTEYFKRWIEPGLGESLDPPGMSLEEAAALYPTDES